MDRKTRGRVSTFVQNHTRQPPRPCPMCVFTLFAILLAPESFMPPGDRVQRRGTCTGTRARRLRAGQCNAQHLLPGATGKHGMNCSGGYKQGSSASATLASGLERARDSRCGALLADGTTGYARGGKAATEWRRQQLTVKERTFTCCTPSKALRLSGYSALATSGSAGPHASLNSSTTFSPP